MLWEKARHSLKDFWKREQEASATTVLTALRVVDVDADAFDI